jgi:ABC-type sugar transport system ATPase subunit/ribose/xylose/arabinose/galactoside ABC-type transport system permease subunit
MADNDYNSLVELRGIGKSFPGVVALAGVDLTLHAGRVHALVGENGAGKSTLLNVLAGLQRPDEGEILIEGKPVHLGDARAAWDHGIVTVHQEVDLFADLSVLENLGWQQGLPAGPLGWINWAELRRRARSALADVDSPMPPDELAARLTPAQRQLVEIAGAISRSARVLVLDEPTSSLSGAEAERLFTHVRGLAARGAAVVYVSHRLEEVFALADEITVLRDGQRVWTGLARQTTPAELIRAMVGRAVSTVRSSTTHEVGAVRLSCRGLTAADGSFADVSLEARAGEVLGIYGLVGAGRTEWAQSIFGLRTLAAGDLRLDGEPVQPRSPAQMAGRGVAYVPEDRLRQGLCRGLDVLANAVLAALRRLATFSWLPPGREQRLASGIVAELGVRCASLRQPVGTLSGGNQQKVVLGRWLAREPGVLLLDEPTRGVDVGAREEIYAIVRRLAGEGRAVVLISSDLHEVMSQSDRIAVFRAGRLAATLPAADATAEQVAEAAFPASAPRSTGCQPVASAVGWVESSRPTGAASGPSGGSRRLDPPYDQEQARLPALREGGRRDLLHSLVLPLFVAAFLLALHAWTGEFLGPGNLRGLGTSAALVSFCAVGAMLVLLVGGLDISLGSLMALSAAVGGRLWQDGASLPVVVVASLSVGAAGGALNAALSLVGRVHPIVITLGTLSAYRGLTHWWLGGRDIQIGLARRSWAVDEWLGVPVLAWLGLLVLVVTTLVLNCTVAGRQLYALGSNPAAARRVGIHRVRVWLGAFAAGGLLAGLAGLLYLAQSGSLQTTDHEERTLEAIAAAVVGGVAITGGRGQVWKVAVGCLFLVALSQACVFLEMPPQRQQVLVGVVLLAAVLLDALLQRRST